MSRPERNSTRSPWRGQSSIQTAAAPDTQAYGHTLCNLKHTHTSVKVHFLLHLGSANFNHLSLSMSLWCSLYFVLVYSCAFSHAAHSQLYTETQDAVKVDRKCLFCLSLSHYLKQLDYHRQKKMQKCPAEELNLAHLLPQGAVISSDCVEFRAFSDNMSEI